MRWLGQAVVRTPQEPPCTARPSSMRARPARPQLGLAETCFLLLRTSHTVRPQQGDFHLPLPGAEGLSPKAPDKYTGSSLSGRLITDFALEPGRDFWAFEAKKQQSVQRMNTCRIRRDVTDVLLDVSVFRQLFRHRFISSLCGPRPTYWPVQSKKPVTFGQ